MPFGMEKLEWCGYPMVNKFEDMFIRFDRMYKHDTHTHTGEHHMTAKAALDASKGMFFFSMNTVTRLQIHIIN